MSARIGLAGAVLVVAGAMLIAAGTVVGGGPASQVFGGPGGMMGRGGGSGMMGGGPGMMGRGGDWGGAGRSAARGPRDPGFVAGTPADPRVVRVVAGPGYGFTPAVIEVAKGETVTFEVTSMGGLVHEFMVGPADAVAADRPGTPEAEDIGMMQTKSVTVTFDGPGPYAFACHVAGHFEAGMRGSITVVG